MSDNFDKYQVTRRQFADAALACQGWPFRHQGRGELGAVDCVGLLYVALKTVEYPAIIDVEGYRRTPSATVIRETMRANFDEIPVSECGLGDIFLMRLSGAKAKHASVIVSVDTDIARGVEPMIIHTRGFGSSGKAAVEPLRQWIKFCVYGYRLKGLID